ncbi:MAG: response regulator transcription factor [Actinobacteria bacterium]|nr:MAG: response regulator transcription factor [Actinomycetota bacterium]
MARKRAETIAEERADEAPARPRVILADDDVLLRAGLASLLANSGFDVAGQAADGTELIALVREHEPDLAIVDIRMPPTHSTEGLEAAQLIRQDFPETAILVLSAHVEVEHAMTLLETGHRSGYLLKSRITHVDEFVETVGRIVRGLTDLTQREREVLSLMAQGRSNSGIARRLWVTEGTVEKHVHNILGKLRLPDTDDDHRRVLAVVAFLGSR